MQIVQWYPGHMFKAKKELITQLKVIDVVVEVIDARVPFSSHNEMLDELTQGKAKLLVFSKIKNKLCVVANLFSILYEHFLIQVKLGWSITSV